MADNHIPPHNDSIPSRPKQPLYNEKNKTLIAYFVVLLAIVGIIAFVVTHDIRIVTEPLILYPLFRVMDYFFGKSDKTKE